MADNNVISITQYLCIGCSEVCSTETAKDNHVCAQGMYTITYDMI